MMNRRHFIQIGATSILALSANRFAMAKGKSDVELRIVATTDVHSFLTDFDYYKMHQPINSVLLVRQALFVKHVLK